MMPDMPVAAWGSGLRVFGPLDDGHRSIVLAAELDAVSVVLRHSTRPADSLRWELDLLEHLRRCGIAVPEIIPCTTGELQVNGWHLQRRLDGRHCDRSDRAELAAVLRSVHANTINWPQRPGSRSTSSLSAQDRGGDIDLASMPPYLVRRIRQAWDVAQLSPQCVVHGDPGPGNVLILLDGTCALIDWDEARVDDPALDLVEVGEGSPDVARAALAWEIAVCWHIEPDYAASLVPRLLADTGADSRGRTDP